MELIQKGKNFRLVLQSELPDILRFLDRYLPESLKLHQTIKLCINNPIWGFLFYVSKEWPEKPVIIQFPGCTLSPDKNIYQSFSIFCPLSNLKYVDLVTNEDILINWKKPMYLHFTHTTIVSRLNDFYRTFGTMEELVCDILILNDLNVNLEIEDFPNDEAEIRLLKVEDVKLIHEHYPAKQIESVELFEVLVQKLPALGIFNKSSNELASWMLCSYYGAMFSMQTLPKYRRKGYGIQVAKALTKRVIECDLVPYVAVLPHNAASQNLYRKLGFENAYQMSRVKMTPHPFLK
ncbi:glycine N-acyltransferase-like protein 2 isoform X2 [Eupeodes corollae]|nr:glycine N-acyltransferase-like protein 2 isoform X2 [Eupeodes corollae]XP_055921000.1 glycine N-acyltransferase-like protein 2 isoform X2 [Eupeodes corollae]XP_055921001.1 glycine N-acyltransferase-like protein 2 isoform X2 [Eupeodes corollae]XP_055921002.1 glycine N-acyltransferase-like protein 2 isoform X2 [Eupeodes corollae]